MPHFEEVARRVKPLIAGEVALKNEMLREEANDEFDQVWEEDDELRKANELLGEALEGIREMEDVPTRREPTPIIKPNSSQPRRSELPRVN